MGSDPRALFRSLVVVTVLAAAGFGLPVRAHSPGEGGRLATIPVHAVAGAGTAEVRLPLPATHVGVRWRGSEAATVEIRWREPAVWGAWRPLSVWEDAGDDDAGVVASGLVRPPPGVSRLALRWPPDAAGLTVVAIDAGGRDPIPVMAPQDGLRPRRAGNGSGPPQPEVISRSTWGADEGKRKGPIEFAPISKLVVHHTVTANDDPDPAQTVRAVYAYHTRHNGWNDIGYNFLVDQQGRVYEGRFARSYRPGEVPTGEDRARPRCHRRPRKGQQPGGRRGRRSRRPLRRLLPVRPGARRRRPAAGLGGRPPRHRPPGCGAPHRHRRFPPGLPEHRRAP